MPYQLEIESLAYGGAGVGRRDGRAVFVEASAPGDLVEVEALPGPDRPQRARLLSVLRSGAARVEPRCPHYGECGGCQWQHVSSEAQLEAKRRALGDALRRIGKLPADSLPEIEAVAAPSPWRYRRRARLAVFGEGALGFSARASRRVVRIGSCDLLSRELERLVLALSEGLSRHPVPGLSHVEVVHAGGRGAAELQLRPGARLQAARGPAELLLGSCKELAGVVLTAGSTRVIIGDPVLPEGALLLRPDVFAQASLAGSTQLVSLALEMLRPRASDRALELYCGSGNFSFALGGRAASLVAVEEEPEALRLARRALPAALAGKVTFEQLRAEVALQREIASGHRFDVALLDPPRAGAKDVAPLLARIVDRTIVYVSCDPATLARDVGALCQRGWRPIRIAALDLFPQTYHLEALIALERT